MTEPPPFEPPFSDEVRKALEGIVANFAQVTEPLLRVQEMVRELFPPERLQEMVRAATPTLLYGQQLAEQWLPQMREVLGQYRAAWLAALPPNWEGFDVHEVQAVFEFSRATGWALVWLPRVETVREILRAPDDVAREAILLDRSDGIGEDALAVAQEIEREELVELRDFVLEAWENLRVGRTSSAQAVAAIVFDTAVSDVLNWKRISEARRQMEKQDPDSVGIALLRFSTIALSGARALAIYWGPPAPLPDSFNRNASIHHAAAAHYTPRNALMALILATALLRELDVLLRQSDALEDDA